MQVRNNNYRKLSMLLCHHIFLFMKQNKKKRVLFVFRKLETMQIDFSVSTFQNVYKKRNSDCNVYHNINNYSSLLLICKAHELIIANAVIFLLVLHGLRG
jgi:hypothetical protein